MKFLDEAKIFIRSGNGGSGCTSFRREANVPYGGPDGGNGGNGGKVYAKAFNNLNTLIDFRYQQHFKAKNGEPGKRQNKTGASAKPLILKVPVGTQIFCENKLNLIADLKLVGDRVLLARSGRGGRGNNSFKSSANQTPRLHEPGEKGEENWVWLRLKLIADVGIIGLPNAGKSTFLSSVTNAKPKIDSYPFTTLVPQMGVVRHGETEFVLADIPGLIEGAHTGTGLGTRFLAHIERCGVLLHVIDGTSNDVVRDYRILRSELTAYGSNLEKKFEVVVLNKCDAVQPSMRDKHIDSLREVSDSVLPISAVTRRGCLVVIDTLNNYIKKYRNYAGEQTNLSMDIKHDTPR